MTIESEKRNKQSDVCGNSVEVAKKERVIVTWEMLKRALDDGVLDHLRDADGVLRLSDREEDRLKLLFLAPYYLGKSERRAQETLKNPGMSRAVTKVAKGNYAVHKMRVAFELARLASEDSESRTDRSARQQRDSTTGKFLKGTANVRFKFSRSSRHR